MTGVAPVSRQTDAQTPDETARKRGARQAQWWSLDQVRHGPPQLRPQFDRLLILAAVLGFLSLYLPWLPGLYGPVPGWRVPYSALEIPLDQIRWLEDVARPDSLFLMPLVGALGLLFCRTSRYAGVRDVAAAVLLVAGGGYVLIYFFAEWSWCLLYYYVGSYAAFMSLGLTVVAGLLRTRWMPWMPRNRLLLLAASAYLMTAWFMPWSRDYSGVMLWRISPQFYWLGSARPYALLMPIFPLLGMAAFASVFMEPTFLPKFMRRCWALCFGLAALAYFRALWARYLAGFTLGAWGTLAGLSLLSAAGIFQIFPERPMLARLLVWLFTLMSIVFWLAFITERWPPELFEELFGLRAAVQP